MSSTKFMPDLRYQTYVLECTTSTLTLYGHLLFFSAPVCLVSLTRSPSQKCQCPVKNVDGLSRLLYPSTTTNLPVWQSRPSLTAQDFRPTGISCRPISCSPCADCLRPLTDSVSARVTAQTQKGSPNSYASTTAFD